MKPTSSPKDANQKPGLGPYGQDHWQEILQQLLMQGKPEAQARSTANLMTRAAADRLRNRFLQSS